jgi:DNA-binding transcriptional regulator YhcF (GntR family)
MTRQAAHDRLRVATRLSIGFALDLLKLGGYGRDVVDAVLLAAISQANVAQVTRSPELQRRYATLDAPPPDELRRPVSVNAVANSLGIPFETARRRVAALVEAGIVRSTPRGVVIPSVALVSPLYKTVTRAHYDLIRELYVRLRGLGFLEDLPKPEVPGYDPDNPPIRLVVRLSADYLLRLAEPIALYIGDFVDGVILLTMLRANTEHLPDSEGGTAEDDWSPESFVEDAKRRPIRAAALSARLGVPAETVRRRLARLESQGRCERTQNGYLITSRVMARERLVRFVMDNQSHLQRLYAGLADLGVLAWWEHEILGLRGAA